MDLSLKGVIKVREFNGVRQDVGSATVLELRSAENPYYKEVQIVTPDGQRFNLNLDEMQSLLYAFNAIQPEE